MTAIEEWRSLIVTAIPIIGCQTAEQLQAATKAMIRRAPEQETVDVLIAGVSGCWYESEEFHDWLRTYEHRSRLRAVAADDLSVSNLVLFLAFERRTAIPWAMVNPRTGLHGPRPEDSDTRRWFREKVNGYIARCTAMSPEDIATAEEQGTWIHGPDLWRLGFCTETYEFEPSKVLDGRQQPQDIRTKPVLFISTVTESTINKLMEQIEAGLNAEGDSPINVVLATPGGELGAASAFHFWLSTHEHRTRIRVVAAGPTTSAGTLMFLAFGHREVTSFGNIGFHDVGPKTRREDPTRMALDDIRTGYLCDYLANHVNIHPRILRSMMENTVGMGAASLRGVGVLPK